MYEQLEFDLSEVLPPVAPDEEHLEDPEEVHR
jgi:hypothetical protein